MYPLIDTHAHLYLADFELDRSMMLDRAKQAGIEKIFLPAIDSSTHTSLLQMETDFPWCKAMMGVHPCSIKENYQEELAIAQQYWDKRNFVAVGEIGLDFYWDRTFEKEQYEAFRIQIEWALEKNVPIVIHSRQSTLDCVRVLKEYKNSALRGVFHCFSGSLEEAQEIIKLGFYLGIGGVITYKNAGLGAVIEKLDLAHLVVETDAPYLTPVPHRGKRNESAYISLIAEKIATVKAEKVEKVAEITTQNAENLFR
ncbi:MAG: TatD family deoxyribonuclease [Chitinophagaceae bacterium]|jgi:TatD DNase family protein|nr:TatD family deoxyribonuclease [Chitinophagaceae bacterium]